MVHEIIEHETNCRRKKGDQHNRLLVLVKRARTCTFGTSARCTGTVPPAGPKVLTKPYRRVRNLENGVGQYRRSTAATRVTAGKAGSCTWRNKYYPFRFRNTGELGTCFSG